MMFSIGATKPFDHLVQILCLKQGEQREGRGVQSKLGEDNVWRMEQDSEMEIWPEDGQRMECVACGSRGRDVQARTKYLLFVRACDPYWLGRHDGDV